MRRALEWTATAFGAMIVGLWLAAVLIMGVAVLDAILRLVRAVVG